MMKFETMTSDHLCKDEALKHKRSTECDNKIKILIPL